MLLVTQSTRCAPPANHTAQAAASELLKRPAIAGL
jgi:hypothetical protein